MSRTKPGQAREKEPAGALAREIAHGLRAALEVTRGESAAARITHLELPEPAPEYGNSDVQRERHRMGLSQSAFARIMNISSKTVEAWEAGTKKPGPPSRRLLQILSDVETLKIVARQAGFDLIPAAKREPQPARAGSKK
ncbi:hypothetical protein GC173_11285 [bacterium]|nr:hypothetical protein [bacterium]